MGNRTKKKLQFSLAIRLDFDGRSLSDIVAKLKAIK